MLISIITPTYNSAATIRHTLESVANQSYCQVEHIIIDGGSKDQTLDIIRDFPHVTRVVSEPDQGIFDGMNKGIRLASGDLVGVLNSDDFFAHADVLQHIHDEFQHHKIDILYADVQFVHPHNLTRVVRNYSAQHFKPWMFAFGFTPPHPTFYTYRKNYLEFGLFHKDYKYAADYELMMRFMRTYKLKSKYIRDTWVIMRTGGASNSTPYVKLGLNREIVRACKSNGVYTNIYILFLKYGVKIFEYITPRLSSSTLR